MKSFRILLVGIALVVSTLTAAQPVHAGGVIFECTGAFVTARGGQAIVVNDQWTFDVNQARAQLVNGTIVNVPFVRVSPSSYSIGELPPGSVRVFVRYGLSHVKADGSIEYWGDPRGIMEHEFDLPPECMPPPPPNVDPLQVTTKAATPSVAIPTNAIALKNIDTANGKLVGVGTKSAPVTIAIKDVVTVAKATPSGAVKGTVVAYPIVNGARVCTKGSAAAAFAGTANASGSVTITTPPVTVSLAVSLKWEFIESVTDVASGRTAARSCATSPIRAVEVTTFTGPKLGFITKTAGIVSYSAVGNATAGAVDYVAVFGGMAGQKVSAEVYAVRVDTATNKRVCATRTPAVKASGTLAANGTALLKMPPVQLPLLQSLKWEFIETVTVAGTTIKRDCARAARSEAETVRAGYLPLWYMGGGPIRETAPPPAPTATIAMPRLGSTLPVRLANPAVSASTLGAGLWQHSSSETLCTVGNAVVGGHRTSAGGPMRQIHTFAIGDRVTVTTAAGKTCTYRVVAKNIVDVNDPLRILRLTMNVPVPTADTVMTLFSCTDATGLRTARTHRYIITLVKV